MQTSPPPPLQPQRIGVPRETFPLEKRVATVPDVVEKLIKLGFAVAIQSGAGDGANFSDDAYRDAGWDERRDPGQSGSSPEAPDEYSADNRVGGPRAGP